MLEDILIKYFGCKKAFKKKRRIGGYYPGSGTPEPVDNNMTKTGSNAYGKLTELLYDLENIFGKEFEANKWVEKLDKITSEPEY